MGKKKYTYAKRDTGYWIYSTTQFRGYSCSICHEKYEEEANIRVWRFRYCPQCGNRLLEIRRNREEDNE